MDRLDLIIKENLNILKEESNPAWGTKKSADPGLKQIWGVIEQKREELNAMIFGELGENLDELTRKKSKLMGKEHLRVPDTICTAGNDKLPSNVLIVNMSSSLMCPSFYLGLCLIKGGTCYAQRDENQYTTTVMPNRFQTDLMHTEMLRQYQKGNKKPMNLYFSIIEQYIHLSRRYTKVLLNDAIQHMEIELNRKLTPEELNFLKKEHERHQIADIRLNETGDFHCQLAVDLWADFAQKIKQKYGINTHAYTARELDYSKASKDINFNYSRPMKSDPNNKPRLFIAVTDQKYDSLEDTQLEVLGVPQLKVDKGNHNKLYYKCPCADEDSSCKKCRVCFNKNETGEEYIIYARQHGNKFAKGLKGAFTKNEIKPIINIMSSEDYGWATEDEKTSFKNPETQRKLEDFTSHVNRLRTDDEIRKTKEKKKKKK